MPPSHDPHPIGHPGASAPETIWELCEARVEADPTQTWLVYEDSAFTWAETRECIGRAAAALEDLGLVRGDVVLATMPSTPEHVFLWLASAYAGTILVTVNPKATESELAGLIDQTQPSVIVARGHVEIAALYERAGDVAADRRPRADDPVVLIPTSGTTGRSKLVTQTQRAYTMAGEGFPWWMELGPDDRLMTSLPLFHINAPAYSMLGSVAAGASFALLPRFSASGFIDSARRHGATEFNAIGAMLEILMRQPSRPDDADNPLRLCYTGPAPTRERQLEIETRFGLRIVAGYAMSETPYGTIWARGTRPYGTLGSIRQHPRLGVVNEGRVVDGELQLRNPAVMLGYWGMPDETSEVLAADGWLRTGDLVEPNADGTYTFLGRRKEVIRRRGENVAPGEIEDALLTHPDVLEAAVIGVPSDLSEEDIKAFVLVGDPAAADLGEIRACAAAVLTPFKLPRYLEAVTDLPRTPTGRVAKHRLDRDRTAQEADFA